MTFIHSEFFLVLESFSQYFKESIMMTDFEKNITKAMISTYYYFKKGSMYLLHT